MLDFWLWLYSKPGVGTSRLRALIQKYGVNLSKNLRLKVQSLLLAQVVSDSVWNMEVTEIQQNLDQLNISVIAFWDDLYPEKLKTIPDFPVFLFTRGQGVDWQIPTVSIIGTRKITCYGQNVVKKLLDPILNFNINVVTGLAWGVDSVVHRYMLNLKSSAKPIAVLAGGPLAGYPSANRHLYHKICENGLVLSEYLPDTPIKKGMFVSRNRLAAAISDLIVVVEASEGSGSLITAQFGVDYNREVGSVPGSIFSKQSKGTLELIKQGAIPISAGEDIVQILDLSTDSHDISNLCRDDYVLTKLEEVTRVDKKSLNNLYYKLLDGDIIKIDDLEKMLNKTQKEVRVCLTMLEVHGILRLERSGVIKLNQKIL